VTLPVRYRLGDAPGLTDAELVEVSLGGGQLRCQPRPPVGGALVLQLLPPGATAPIEIAGRVSYHVDSDRVGVQFVFRGGGGVGRLRELIRRICAA
jgi:hypothetical protein